MGGKMTRERDDGTSRRAVLGGTAAAITIGTVPTLGRQTAERRGGDAEREQDGATRAERAFRFGGREQGWYGRAPQPVAGLANPTLHLEPGAVYEVTWENLDGLPHNFAFLDADENFLPVILPEGADVEATPVENATGGNETPAGTRTETTGFPENGIEQTEIIRQQGQDQTFRFVAVEEMTEYLCVIHPERMDGRVTVGARTTESE